MNAEDLKIGMRVRYVPCHAHGDVHHKDCEDGIVRSIHEDMEWASVVYDNSVRGVLDTLEKAMPWNASCTDIEDLHWVAGNIAMSGDEE